MISASFIALLFLTGCGQEQEISQEQQTQTVLEETYNISKEYAALRYRTDHVLIDAKSFENYETWNEEMSDVIKKWETLEQEALVLEKAAGEMAEEKMSFRLFPEALAYNQQEISDVFDRAPAGKKIKTLAKFLGVDAKKAFQMLKQDQDQIQADIWNDEGDAFQALETTATVIKDGAKVTVFVGSVIVSGGVSAIATGSTLTQAAVVVSGVDLTLEITDDAAKIALGNHNKISQIVSDARIVTEPIATILTITDVPNNLTKGIEKFNAVMLALEQFRVSAQEGKVVGIQLPAYTGEKTKAPIEVSVLEQGEVQKWIADQGIENDPETIESIKKILEINQSESQKEEADSTGTKEVKIVEEVQNEEPKAEEISGTAEGVWEGTLKFTPSSDAEEESIDYAFTLNNDGTVSTLGEKKAFRSWTQEGNAVKLFMEIDSGEGYYEFLLAGDTLTFVKLAGPNSEGEWQEDFAGEDFFGGKFYEILLERQ